MLNRKIAKGSERLNQFSDYRLKKMWLNAEIDKCPICRRYHDKDSDGEKLFISNMSLCNSCKKAREIMEEWEH